MRPAGETWQYGDRLLLSGQPVDPPESAYSDFSYREYLAHQGIYTYLAYPRLQRLPGRAGSPLLSAIYALRQRAHQVLTALFPPPEGPLLDGILLGLDQGLPAEIETAFRRTGTSHIIAISGFNMTILAGLFTIIFGRLLSRWWAALAALLAIAAYTLLVGAGPAVVRAAVMSALSLAAVQIGRSAGGLNALMLAAGVMCLFNPDLPWDIGFQLSFAATLGLLLYASRLEGILRRYSEARLPARWAGVLSGLVAENVLFTLIAQAFTLPVIVYHFGRVSLVAPFANLLVLPAQSALMILSGSAVLLGMVWLPLARLLAFPAWALAAYTLRVVGWLGGSPGVEWVLNPGGFGWVLLAYAGLLSLAFAGGWIKAHLPRLRPALVFILLAGTAVFLWRQALAGPDGRLHLIAYNLDGQMAVFVRAPGGQSMLLAGSQRASQLSAALGRWLPPLNRRLDGLLVNSPKSAALNALPEVMARFPPRAAFLGVTLPNSAAGRALQEAFAQRDLQPTRLEPGASLAIDPHTRLSVPACGDSACTLLLEMGAFSALLPGGSPPASLPAVNGAPSVLLLTPADLDAATQFDWQARFAPAFVFSPATLPPGAWVHVQTDGDKMWVERGR
jgi:competence protein ComEC